MLRMPILDVYHLKNEEQLLTVNNNIKTLNEAMELGDSKSISAECLDVIQSAMGLLMLIVPSEFELTRQVLRHELETKSREANGGNKILGWLNMDQKNGY